MSKNYSPARVDAKSDASSGNGIDMILQKELEHTLKHVEWLKQKNRSQEESPHYLYFTKATLLAKEENTLALQQFLQSVTLGRVLLKCKKKFDPLLNPACDPKDVKLGVQLSIAEKEIAEEKAAEATLDAPALVIPDSIRKLSSFT